MSEANGRSICWRSVAAALPGRNNKSCRKRYYLSPLQVSLSITPVAYSRWIHSLNPDLRKGTQVRTLSHTVKAPSPNEAGLQARCDARRRYKVSWRTIHACRSRKAEEDTGGRVGHSRHILSSTLPQRNIQLGQEVVLGRYMLQRITLLLRLSQSISRLFLKGKSRSFRCHDMLPSHCFCLAAI